jgi:prepilin-type N-terminal cleavage/methylation domain-containing protein
MLFSPKSIRGVTLLEIMLVLAIAAVVIMTSVKFYKGANASQQSAAFLEQVQTIITVADTLAQGASAYAAVTQKAVSASLGGSQYMGTQWGSFSFNAPANGATSYTITYPVNVPTAIWTAVNAQLSANPRIVTITSAGFTYDSTQ